MALFVVRVWLPDRPGALGAVASRVGALHADVVGIDILERGGGRAVDELTVNLEDASHVDLLVQEIGQVDGVDVEHVRPARNAHSRRTVDSIEMAPAMLNASDTPSLLNALVLGLAALFEADWAAVIDASSSTTLAVSGSLEMPSAEWLTAFVIGSNHSDGSFAAVDELARVALDETPLQVLVSRSALPLRRGELEILDGLAQLAVAHLQRFTDTAE